MTRAAEEEQRNTGQSEYRVLGDTGISVSTLGFGAMMLGTYGNPDHDQCTRMLHRAIDAGINFIDTADVYSGGESESIIGAAVKHCRDDLIIATKFTIPRGRGPNERGHSRKWVMRAVEESLRRLDTDYIDLYQAHRPDPNTNIDELLGTLTTLIQQGKVRAIGSSTFPAHEIVEAQWVAERRGRERFLSEQPPYSLLARGIERDVLPVCSRYGMGVVTWGPLAGGWLSGRFDRGIEQPRAPRNLANYQRYDLESAENQRKFDIVEQVNAVAKEAGLTLPRMAVAFAMNHRAVTSVLIGPRTPEHLENLLDVTTIRLDGDLLDRLDSVAPPGVYATTADAGYEPPSIANPTLRRRPAVSPST
jgi:aryl-alcohol dehydrogenase-like predicted oxidoreductase